MERVPRHLGNVEQPRNSPLRPERTTIGAPQRWQGMSVIFGLAFSPFSGRVYLHFFGWFSQARKGPKKPPRGSSRPPQSGHFSLAIADRSCAAAMRAPESTFFSELSKGDRKSVV